jgi:predicted MFS family arabinose efflux permease
MSSSIEARAPKESSQPAAESASRQSAARIVWAVFLLFLVSVLAMADRNVLAVLLVPIQKELGASDGAMGALTGTAFAVVYATMALPLARLVDYSNRRNILGIAVLVWSAATALAGMATSYLHLLLARIGVAGAESVQYPATMSMVVDLSTRNRRGTMVSVILIGAAIGFSLGAYAAGTLNAAYGWRVTMMSLSLPGLVVSLLLLFTVAEPRRDATAGTNDGGPAEQRFIDTLRRLAHIKTLWTFAVGFVLFNMGFEGWLIWMPAFLMRVHHLESAHMGAVFGAIIAGGALSGLVAGPVTDRLARRGERWRLYYCCGSIMLSVPLLAATTLVSRLNPAVGLALAYTIVAGGLSTVGAVVYLSIAPSDARGVVTALMNLCASMLGAGLAAPLFGIVNDTIKPFYGDESLRYTLLLAPLFLALSGVMLFIASRTVEADIESAPLNHVR